MPGHLILWNHATASHLGGHRMILGQLLQALTLYKAAQGQETPSAKIKAAFLKLVDFMG